MIGKKALLRATVSCGLMMVSMAMVPTPAAAQATTAYQIRSASLSQALREFGRRSGRQIIFTEDLVRGRRAPDLVGTFSAEDALARLLAGSGLRAERTSAGAYMIVRESAEPERRNSAELTSDDAAPAQSDIVVTGTRIAGGSPASPVIRITRDQMLASGAPSMREVIADLPQNYNGASPYVLGARGSARIGQLSFGAAPSLRGLDDATLTLVNGRRLASAALTNASDISIVPLAAVERVEVLTDGASAIYGSDAIAGVVNVILRRDFSGLETSASFLEPTRGGAERQRFSALGGITWRGGNLMVGLNHERQEKLDSDERDFSNQAVSPTWIVPSYTDNSIIAALHQEVNPSLNVFVEAMGDKRRGINLNASSAILYGLSNQSVKQYALSAGAELDVGGGWSATLSGSSGYNISENVQQAYLNNVLFATPTLVVRSRSEMLELNGTGPLVSLPGGQLQIAVGGSLRRQSLSFVNSGRPAGPFSRVIRAAYAELRVPVIGNENPLPFIHELSLIGSLRLDDYSDFGLARSPKVGFVFRPIPSLRIRGTWSRSFRAPKFADISQGVSGGYTSFPDPQSPTGQTNVLSLSGSNASLRPETARTWTVGFDLTPDFAPGLTVSATYFNTLFGDRIATPVLPATAALTSSLYDPFVIRNPTAAQINSYYALITLAPFTNNIPGGSYLNAGAIVDNRVQNFATWRARGLDILIQYRHDVGLGSVNLSANVSILDSAQRLFADSAPIPTSGTIYNAAHVRGRAGGTWSYHGINLSLFSNYVSPFTDTVQVPNTRLRSNLTFDMQLGYETSSSNHLLDGWRFNLNVRNIFDRDPPRLALSSSGIFGYGYDSTNFDPVGRVIGFEITKRW